MLEDAGLIGMMAALGTVGGDLLLRGIQNITRKFTGNNIPDEVVQRIRVRIEQLRAKDAAPEKALDMSKKKLMMSYENMHKISAKNILKIKH